MLLSLFLKKKSNRRTASRRKTRNLVLISEPEEQIVNLIDISEAGLQFSSPKPYRRHKTVILKINIAERDCQVVAMGRVVWSKLVAGSGSFYRVGITFKQLSEEAWALLRHYAAASQAA